MKLLLIYTLIGGGLVARFCHRKDAVGRTPLSWLRGVLAGAALTVGFCLLAGCGDDPAAMNQSTANVKHITEGDFAVEVTSATQPVVADFYATWCGPCRQLAPVMDRLAGEYAGKIKFVKINVDESPKLARQFQVEGIPNLVFFKNGQKVANLLGLQSRMILTAQLDALLATNLSSTAVGR